MVNCASSRKTNRRASPASCSMAWFLSTVKANFLAYPLANSQFAIENGWKWSIHSWSSTIDLWKKRDFPLRKQFTGGSLHDPIFISPKSRNPVASRPGLPTLLMYWSAKGALQHRGKPFWFRLQIVDFQHQLVGLLENIQ